MDREAILKPGKYFLIAFNCFSLALILPRIFPTFTLENQNGLKINEVSAVNVTDCYNKEFHLEKGDKCYIEFSDYYPNITRNLIFMRTVTYLTHLDTPTPTDPNTIPGGIESTLLMRYINIPVLPLMQIV